jgi:hypothetical protein
MGGGTYLQEFTGRFVQKCICHFVWVGEVRQMSHVVGLWVSGETDVSRGGLWVREVRQLSQVVGHGLLQNLRRFVRYR